MTNTNTIRDFYGRILGFIEEDTVTGDKTGRDFYRRVVGKYHKSRNVTTDFYGRVVAQGDILASLIRDASNH